MSDPTTPPDVPDTTDATDAPSGRRGPRRSTGPRRRVGAGLLLAVALPVVLALALLVLRPVTGTTATAPAVRGQAPARAALTAAALSCPGVETGTDPASTGLGVASLADADATGEATTATGAVGSPLALVPGPVVSVTEPGATTVRATGGLAPALVATRSVTAPLAAVGCRPGAFEQWFSGVGAGADHSSVLELVNAETGPAVAEVTVWSNAGAVDVPALRGVAVPAGTTSRLDLSQLVPRRGNLGLRVEVTRGRLGVDVLDRQDPLTGAAVSTDWLAPASAPATSTTLLGLARGDGSRELSVVNPGDDAVGVRVEVITKRATFEPEGLEAIRVGPGSTTSVSLDALLAEASRRGGIGLLVESTAPVAAALRQVTGGGGVAADLSLLGPAEPLDDSTAAVVPVADGVRSRLLLTGAAAAGTVGVRATDAAGTELLARDVDLAPDAAANLALPRGTALVRLDPRDLAGQVRGAVLVQRPGVTVLPLTDLQRTTREPVVRPGLP